MKATLKNAAKLAEKYHAAYGYTIEVDGETLTVWHDSPTHFCNGDVARDVALDIAKALNAPSVTHDGAKSIVWYKRAPKLDLDNKL